MGKKGQHAEIRLVDFPKIWRLVGEAKEGNEWGKIQLTVL